jgi:hypothetical protein
MVCVLSLKRSACISFHSLEAHQRLSRHASKKYTSCSPFQSSPNGVDTASKSFLIRSRTTIETCMHNSHHSLTPTHARFTAAAACPDRRCEATFNRETCARSLPNECGECRHRFVELVGRGCVPVSANLALTNIASQSSGDGAAAAVDGIVDRRVAARTASESNPWWEVTLDLPVDQPIVKIYAAAPPLAPVDVGR